MGSSTITVQDIVDTVSTMADVAPQANPSGYDATITLAIANDTLNALIARRFNWKWNSRNGRPFLTNGNQQDYPGIGLTDIGWIESAVWVDANNTSLPLPNGRMESARELDIAYSRSGSYQGSQPSRISWMYNRQLQYGTWPGAATAYTSLRSAMPAPNPAMAILDANGNILTLTSDGGTTGDTAPQLDANAAAGQKVTDGTCEWTVCSPDGQGWRLDVLPPPSGPVYQIWPKYQAMAARITSLQATLDPIPDDYAHHFRVGFRANSYAYAPDARVRSQHPQMQMDWLNSIAEAQGQGDREDDSFGLYPATRISARVFGMLRNPRDPGRPY